MAGPIIAQKQPVPAPPEKMLYQYEKTSYLPSDGMALETSETMQNLNLPEKQPKHSTTALPQQTNISTHHIRLKDADSAATFISGFHGAASPEQSRQVCRKIDLHLMPLLMVMYFIQYLDKTTLGTSSILGLLEDNGLSKSQYNWLGTIFYLAYLVFEWPQNLGLQRYPPGKWMTCNILIWAMVLCATSLCHNFAGLFICRLLLGACEGSITAGFLIVTSMFYTHTEAVPRISYWSLMSSVANIFSGFASFAVYHVDEHVIAPWRVFYLLTGGMTLIVGVCFWFFIPDTPVQARFLTDDEKLIAIARLRNHSTGVENKTWKKDQFIEALTDWKVWTFALYAAVSNVSNSMGNYTALIIESFGFTTGQTTLLGTVNGAMEVLGILFGIYLFNKFPNSRAYLGAWFALPNIISGILLVALPWSAQGALLFAMYISFWGGPDFIFAMAWLAATTTGHTKKTTANAMLFIGYSLGNLLSPQMWEGKYAPRYYVPWGIILGTYVARPVMLLVMRHFIVKENRRRDENGSEKVEKFVDEHGQEVDPTFLDVIDRKNLAFRYPL